MAGRENVSDRYLASGFGGSGVESTIARMLGKDVPEKPQFCAECGEPTSPGYQPSKDSPNVYCKTHYEKLFASKCEGCNQPIVGQFMSHKGKKYHAQCAPESGRCDRCSKPVFGESVTLFEKIYHAKCFTCSKCDASLASSYEEIGKSPFCAKCAREINEARASKQAIPGVLYENAADKQRREQAKIQNELYANVQGGKEGCVWCRKIITTQAVSFGGKLYHEECFSCTACGDVIGSAGYSERDGGAYCQKCTKPTAVAAGTCAGCRNALAGQFVTALDAKYHPQCLKCSECSAALKGGFAAKAGKPVCANCAAPKVTVAAAGSGEKQRGFVIDPRSGRKITQ